MKSKCKIYVDNDQLIHLSQDTSYTLDEYLAHAKEVYKLALSLRDGNDKVRLEKLKIEELEELNED